MVNSKMISVIMPTYNTHIAMLQESVESILKQTCSNFEFLIIDDGSTNGSDKYLKSLTDERVHIIRNSENIGITKSLNIGLKIARGKYIVRMDADDVSMPTRFEKQLAYMEEHPNVFICGTRNAFLIEDGDTWRVTDDNPQRKQNQKTDMDMYRIKALFTFPGPDHPTLMINRVLIDKYNLFYDESLTYAQDYDLLVRTSRLGDIYTLSETLHYRRRHSDQITQAHRKTQAYCAKVTQRKLLKELLGSVTDEEVDFHYVHSTGYYRNATISAEADQWYKRIIEANHKRCIYDEKKLKWMVEQIKIQLIEQTFTTDMTKIQKALLLFRYLSFISAFKTTIRILLMKVKGVKQSI